MTYDFQAARQRIQELTAMYLQATDELTKWALAAEIDELEREITEAHKKAADQGDCKKNNILMFPIVAR